MATPNVVCDELEVILNQLNSADPLQTHAALEILLRHVLTGKDISFFIPPLVALFSKPESQRKLIPPTTLIYLYQILFNTSLNGECGCMNQVGEKLCSDIIANPGNSSLVVLALKMFARVPVDVMLYQAFPHLKTESSAAAKLAPKDAPLMSPTASAGLTGTDARPVSGAAGNSAIVAPVASATAATTTASSTVASNANAGKEGLDTFGNYLLNLVRPSGGTSASSHYIKKAAIEAILVLVGDDVTSLAALDPTVRKWLHNFWSLAVYYIAKSVHSSDLVGLGFKALGVAVANFRRRPDIEANFEFVEFFYHQLVQKADTDSIYSGISALKPLDKCAAIRNLGALLAVIFEGTNQVRVMPNLDYYKSSIVQKFVEKKPQLKTLKMSMTEYSQSQAVFRAMGHVSVHLLPFIELVPAPSSEMVFYETIVTLLHLYKTKVPCPSWWLVSICEALKKLLHRHIYDLPEGEVPNLSLCSHLLDFALETVSLIHGSEADTYITEICLNLVQYYLQVLPLKKKINRLTLIYGHLLKYSIRRYNRFTSLSEDTQYYDKLPFAPITTAINLTSVLGQYIESGPSSSRKSHGSDAGTGNPQSHNNVSSASSNASASSAGGTSNLLTIPTLGTASDHSTLKSPHHRKGGGQTERSTHESSATLATQEKAVGLSEYHYQYCTLRALLLERSPFDIPMEFFYIHTLRWAQSGIYFMRKFSHCLKCETMESTFPIDLYLELCEIVFSTVFNVEARLSVDFKKAYPHVNPKEIPPLSKALKQSFLDLKSREVSPFLNCWPDLMSLVQDRCVLIRVLSIFVTHCADDMSSDLVKQCVVPLGFHFLSKFDGAYALGLSADTASYASHSGTISHSLDKQETSEIDSELIVQSLAKITMKTQGLEPKRILMQIVTKFAAFFHNSEPFSYHKTMLLKDSLALTVERESPAPSPKAPHPTPPQLLSPLGGPNILAVQHLANLSALPSGSQPRAPVTQGYVPLKQSNFNEQWDLFLSQTGDIRNQLDDLHGHSRYHPSPARLAEDRSEASLSRAFGHKLPAWQMTSERTGQYSLSAGPNFAEGKNLFGVSDPIALTITHRADASTRRLVLHFTLVNATLLPMYNLTCRLLPFGQLLQCHDMLDSRPHVQQICTLLPFDAVQFYREFSVEEFSYVGINVAVTIGQPKKSTSFSPLLENYMQTTHSFQSRDYNISINDFMVPFRQTQTDFNKLQAHIPYRFRFRLDLSNVEMKTLDEQFQVLSERYDKVYYLEYANHFQVGFSGKTWFGSVLCVTILGHVNACEGKLVLSFDLTSNGEEVIPMLRTQMVLWAYGFLGIECGSDAEPGQKSAHIFISDGVSNIGQREGANMGSRLKSKFNYVSQSEIDQQPPSESEALSAATSALLLKSWREIKQKSNLRTNADATATTNATNTNNT